MDPFSMLSKYGNKKILVNIKNLIKLFSPRPLAMTAGLDSAGLERIPFIPLEGLLLQATELKFCGGKDVVRRNFSRFT
jgi:hypothetical protein